METKKCTNCKNIKSLNEFYIRSGRKNKPHSLCKICFNSYCTDRWITKKINAIIYKNSKCVDCELQYPKEPYVIFDFHHRDPSKKDVDWSKLRLRSELSINKELENSKLLFLIAI
jgi:hypothetical protein